MVLADLFKSCFVKIYKNDAPKFTQGSCHYQMI